MRIDIVTIFPDFFAAPLALSIPARAAVSGAVAYNVLDLRDFTHDRHRTVDDYPYGGGAGMVIRVDVMEAAMQARYGALLEGAPDATVGGTPPPTADRPGTAGRRRTPPRRRGSTSA